MCRVERQDLARVPESQHNQSMSLHESEQFLVILKTNAILSTDLNKNRKLKSCYINDPKH